MAELVPVLLGTSGFVVGECYLLPEGADIVIGRSRSCDISLRRAAAYLKAAPQSRDDDHEFNTVSRRHLRLQLQASTLRINDLSTNGTFLNDEPVHQAREVDLASGSYSLRLGSREAFRVTRLPKDDPRVIAASAAPAMVAIEDDAPEPDPAPAPLPAPWSAATPTLAGTPPPPVPATAPPPTLPDPAPPAPPIEPTPGGGPL